MQGSTVVPALYYAGGAVMHTIVLGGVLICAAGGCVLVIVQHRRNKTGAGIGVIRLGLLSAGRWAKWKVDDFGYSYYDGEEQDVESGLVKARGYKADSVRAFRRSVHRTNSGSAASVAEFGLTPQLPRPSHGALLPVEEPHSAQLPLPLPLPLPTPSPSYEILHLPTKAKSPYQGGPTLASTPERFVAQPSPAMAPHRLPAAPTPQRPPAGGGHLHPPGGPHAPMPLDHPPLYPPPHLGRQGQARQRTKSRSDSEEQGGGFRQDNLPAAGAPSPGGLSPADSPHLPPPCSPQRNSLAQQATPIMGSRPSLRPPTPFSPEVDYMYLPPGNNSLYRPPSLAYEHWPQGWGSMPTEAADAVSTHTYTPLAPSTADALEAPEPQPPPPMAPLPPPPAPPALGLRYSSPLFKRGKLLTGGQEGKEAGPSKGRGTQPLTAESGCSEAQRQSSQSQAGDAPGAPPTGVDLRATEEAVPLQRRLSKAHVDAAARSGSIEIPYEELKMAQVIGGGGFGQVYRGTWRGTPVAVKVLIAAAQLELDEDSVNDFRAEVEILAHLRHPNICLFMGASLSAPHRCIVTELVSRGSLWEVLREAKLPKALLSDTYATPAGCWPWSAIKKVAECTACGMNYLHCHNPPILHRDLKSANLLLDDGFNVKICDFGLARLKAYTNSMTGNCGTVQWMAPEVLANQKYSETADVYSFAIVCWEMLARLCPYEGMSQIQVALAVLNHQQRPLIPAWCPDNFRLLIEACWQQDPSKRPSFAAVIDCLQADAPPSL